MKKQNDVMFRAVGELEADILEKAEASRAGAGSRRRRSPWRVIVPVAACITVMVTMLVVMMVGVGSEDKVSYMSYNRDDWFVRPDGGVKRELVDQIQKGMFLNDVIELIGKPNRPMGGDFQFRGLQWDLDSGECLHIYLIESDFLNSEPLYFLTTDGKIYSTTTGGKIDFNNTPFDTQHGVWIIEVTQPNSQLCQERHVDYNEWIEEHWQRTDEETHNTNN